MQWTFAIITDGRQDLRISKIIDSIESNNIPEEDYEVLVIGNSGIIRKNTSVIEFDESKKKAWITRKKNLAAEQAKFSNMLIIHDYISITQEWYSGFEIFGEDWDVAMCKIAQPNGIRFRDWVTWQEDGGPNTIKFLDYKDHSLIKSMYISGSLMIVKKEFLMKNPLDETKRWGQSEDVAWSLINRDKWNYRMNPSSTALLLKHKDPWPITNEIIL